MSWIAGRFLSRTVNDLWFLKAVFIAYIAVVFIEKCFKGHWAMYVVCSLLTLLLPGKYNFSLYGFVLPFFLSGYKAGAAAKQWNENQGRNQRICIFAASLIVYTVMLLFFHKDNYIYTTGLSIINSEKEYGVQIGIDFYRAVVAFVGCLMVLEGSTLFTKQINLVTTVSNKSMIIYIVTASIFTYIPQLMSRAGVKTVLGSIPAAAVDTVVLFPSASY